MNNQKKFDVSSAHVGRSCVQNSNLVPLKKKKKTKLKYLSESIKLAIAKPNVRKKRTKNPNANAWP
jgi:hypothetical protein